MSEPTDQTGRAARPLNDYQRVARYLDQTSRGYLTPKQSRRANKKSHRWHVRKVVSR